jgi:hypothetical protein
MCTVPHNESVVVGHLDACELSGGAAYVLFENMKVECTMTLDGTTPYTVSYTHPNEITCIAPDSSCIPHVGTQFCNQWNDLWAVLWKNDLEDASNPDDFNITDISCEAVRPVPPAPTNATGADAHSDAGQCTVVEFDIELDRSISESFSNCGKF